MTTTTPPAQPVRVQPLWERRDLFVEPVWPDGPPYDGDDDFEDDGDS